MGQLLTTEFTQFTEEPDQRLETQSQRSFLKQPTHQPSTTPLLRDLHWLRSPERIDFKLAVLVYRCLHGVAPQYLSGYFQHVAFSNRRRLRSFIVIIAATDSTNTTHNCRRPSFSSRR